MSNVRTDPLTPEEIAEYNERGFLLPIRVLDDEQVETARDALEEHLAGGRESKTYELTDPIIESDQGKATVGTGFGFLPGAVVDQHALKRSRVNRLLGVLADHPDLVGQYSREQILSMAHDH